MHMQTMHSAQINIMEMCKRNMADIPEILIQDSMPDCFDGRDEQVIMSHDVTTNTATCKDRKMIPYIGKTDEDLTWWP